MRSTGLVYPCGCTRKEIADSLLHAHARNTTLAYPGTCRAGLNGKPARGGSIDATGAAVAGGLVFVNKLTWLSGKLTFLNYFVK